MTFVKHAIERFNRAARLLAIAATFLGCVGVAVEGSGSSSAVASIALVCSFIPVTEILIRVLHVSYVQEYAETYITMIALLVMVLKVFADVTLEINGLIEDSFMPVFIVAAVRVRFPWMCCMLIFHHTGLLVRFVLMCRHWLQSEGVCRLSSVTTLGMHHVALQVGISMLSICYMYWLELCMRQSTAIQESLHESHDESMKLLRGMYPDKVVNHILVQRSMTQRQSQYSKQRQSPIREDRGVVTVLFCDIMDFDELVTNLMPLELVLLLDRAFMMFDRICEQHGVTKIETVGKTYMAAGMPRDQDEIAGESQIAKDARNTVMAAVTMLRWVSRSVLGVDCRSKISVRIGINTGPVFSGVVGSQKPQFALFGDTVNTAARMQSTGTRDHVHLSDSTYEHVKSDNELQWEQRDTFAKGKGVMKTHLLIGHTKDFQKMKQKNNELLEKGVTSSRTNTKERVNTLERVPTCELSPVEIPLEAVAGSARSSRDASPEPSETASKLGISEQSKHNMSPIEAPSLTRNKSSDRINCRTVIRHLESCWIKYCRDKFTPRAWLAELRSPKELEPDDLKKLQLSFVVFWMVYAAVSLHIMSNPQGLRGEEMRGVLISTRALFSAVLSVAALLLCVNWRWHRAISTVTNWIQHVMVFLVFASFLCTSISNTMCLQGSGAELWSVFEAFFFAAMILHFCLLRPDLFCAVLCIILNMAIPIFWHQFLAYQVCGLAVQAFIVYSMKSFGRKNQEYVGQMRREHSQVQHLLCTLLPTEILEEMKSGHLSLAYSYEDMTFLFADIVGFTSYCAGHTAEQAVNLVTRLFAEFDDTSAMLGIYKVCTIGDAYVAVNEPKAVQTDRHANCVQLLKLADLMLKIIIRVRQEVQHENLDMRIGLHYGSFVAGVIGVNQLRFDMWGEDVLTGNSIESNGIPGHICVSEPAKVVLEEVSTNFSFKFHKDIELNQGKTLKSYVWRKSGNFEWP